MPFGNFTCVLRTHFKEALDFLFSNSLIKKNDVIPTCKIWMPFGMNMNYDVDRSKIIYNSCFQADNYMYK